MYMKTIIFTIGLLSFLIAPTSAKAVQDLRMQPQSEVWVMSIEVCKDFPPGLQDAIDRGIVFQPWVKATQCRWFGVGTQTFMEEFNNELGTWQTYQDCMDSDISAPEGFTLKTKFCQPIVEYDPDMPRRRN